MEREILRFQGKLSGHLENKERAFVYPILPDHLGRLSGNRRDRNGNFNMTLTAQLPG